MIIIIIIIIIKIIIKIMDCAEQFKLTVLT